MIRLVEWIFVSWRGVNIHMFLCAPKPQLHDPGCRTTIEAFIILLGSCRLHEFCIGLNVLRFDGGSR